MDLFQHRYYKLNKILMMLIGQWPYQSIGARRGIVVALLSLGGIQLTPLIMALVKYGDDRSILLDGALGLVFAAVFLIKLSGFMFNSKKVSYIVESYNTMVVETKTSQSIDTDYEGRPVRSAQTLKLLNRIRKDWHEWAQDREVNILHQYAEQQRKTIIAYLVLNITDHTVFMTQPMIPKIIDLFLKNGTKPCTFSYPVDFYYLDVQKYYFYIIVFLYVCLSTVTTVIATSGVMLICYVQHVCGIYAALGHKLERLGNNRSLVKTEDTRSVLEKKDIASCINRHNGAIEYVNLIAASYSWTFFFTIGFGVILFNIVGLQILLNTNEPESTIRYIVFLLSVTLYFYLDCYISEAVTVHSFSIHFAIHNSRWYELSLGAQKLLQFMTMRCSVPCHLTAGKMLVMSMRSFWLTSKTAISYLTLVRSMQGL